MYSCGRPLLRCDWVANHGGEEWETSSRNRFLFYIWKRIYEHNEKNKTVGLNIQTIEIQKYIFLGNINYVQKKQKKNNIKIHILSSGLQQCEPHF